MPTDRLKSRRSGTSDSPLRKLRALSPGKIADDASPTKPDSLAPGMVRCEKYGCLLSTSETVCFVAVSERCPNKEKSTGVIKWQHISSGEHFCGSCYSYFLSSTKSSSSASKKGENDRFSFDNFQKWKVVWASHCKCEPTLRMYLAQEVMPWWVQCTNKKCRKWREVGTATTTDGHLTPGYIDHFRCSLVGSCSEPEDKRVNEVKQSGWIENMALPALMKESPAARFLQGWYYLDGVGLTLSNSWNSAPVIDGNTAGRTTDSPDDLAYQSDLNDHEKSQINEIMKSFYMPNEDSRALCLRPDVMEYDEMFNFPEYAREQTMFLGLRNLILALWTLNPKRWITLEAATRRCICRGLVRVRCVLELRRILALLTRSSVVNYGLLTAPETIMEPKKESFVIIGAGASGLAAARQLKNLGQDDVIVLEARGRTGGRVADDHRFGVPVGLGAQLITGIVNNPAAVMCVQGAVKFRALGEKCQLLEENGNFAEIAEDRRVDFHFNALLDALCHDWRKKSKEDCCLDVVLSTLHSHYITQSKMRFSASKDRLLNFHRSNLEFSCGACLRDVSALHFDQNEAFAQFTGTHAFMSDGYGKLIEILAENLNIKFDVEVSSVDYSNENKKVTVTTSNGVFSADKVLVTVPLAVLKNRSITFIPDLPAEKLKAIEDLGAGVIEKVAVKFPKKFWQTKIKDADYFGHVPGSPVNRGYFSIFYDFSSRGETTNPSYVLMGYLSGDAAKIVRHKSDEEVVGIFLKCLKSLFPEEDIPEPLDSIVTHWHEDPYSGMCYSFMKVGCEGRYIDDLALEVQNKVFFAGEATNRHFPQTVSGAYVSGVREAGKMCVLNDLTVDASD